MRSAVYASVPALFIANLFLNFAWIDIAITCAATASLIVSFPRAKRSYRLLGLLLLAGGTALAALGGGFAPAALARPFHPLAGALGLFLALPFIQGVIRLGQFDKSLNRLLRWRIAGMHSVYWRTSLSIYLLSFFLSIAAIPAGMQSLAKESPRLQEPARRQFLCRSMVRSFSLAIMWSPIEMIVIVGSSAAGSGYLSVFPALLALSAAFMAADWLLQKRTYAKSERPAPTGAAAPPRRDLNRTAQLLGAAIALFVCISGAEALLGKGMLVSIIAALVVFSLLWSVSLKIAPVYMLHLKKYWPAGVRNMTDMNVLFLSAGYFLTMAQSAGLSELIERGFADLSGGGHIAMLCLAVSASLCLLTFSGVHALVAVALLGSVARPLFAGSEDSLALLLIGTQIALLMINPLNVLSALMMNALGLSPGQLFRWNIGYAACLLLCVNATAYLAFVW